MAFASVVEHKVEANAANFHYYLSAVSKSTEIQVICSVFLPKATATLSTASIGNLPLLDSDGVAMNKQTNKREQPLSNGGRYRSEQSRVMLGRMNGHRVRLILCATEPKTLQIHPK